ncbi:ABC transporter permease [Microbacterium hominis]|uniref:ABC transporter permease n=1 Tax=Microbacterium hominis TaxID=162426 RepID=A0A7D4TS56_9MICO|nr:ABC transporter permease [Microbacterium hominis]QKJ20544.1 ABC transporter permease [Microbacterium hominis]
MTNTTAPPTSVTDTDVVPTHRRPSRVGRFFENYALVILTVTVYAFFSVLPASSAAFPTVNNLNVILGSQAVVATIALAALFPLVAGYFDFSLGAIAAMAQVLSAGFMVNAGLPLWAAVILPILIAGVVGLLNGYFVTRLHMSPFVTTLAMAMLISGVTLWYTSGQTIVAGIDPAITRFGSARFLGLPAVVYVVLGLAAVAWYLLTHTPFGRSLYAIGSNAASARLVGVRVDRNVWWTFVVSAVIAGGAGVMQLSRMGSATASAGNELLFPALAAVFLGATTIVPGFFNVVGTIVGAVFVSISVSGLTLSGASGWAANVFNGIALLGAVALSTYLGRRRRRG